MRSRRWGHVPLFHVAQMEIPAVHSPAPTSSLISRPSQDAGPLPLSDISCPAAGRRGASFLPTGDPGVWNPRWLVEDMLPTAWARLGSLGARCPCQPQPQGQRGHHVVTAMRPRPWPWATGGGLRLRVPVGTGPRSVPPGTHCKGSRASPAPLRYRVSVCGPESEGGLDRGQAWGQPGTRRAAELKRHGRAAHLGSG